MFSNRERSKNAHLNVIAYCIYFAIGSATIILLLPPLTAATFEISRSYNEGWNAFHATRAYTAAPFYPASDALISNNYPPLSFFIVGAFARLVSDEIMAGRILALLGLAVTTMNIGLTIFHLSGNRFTALFGSVIFLGLVAGKYGSYVGMNDPQWLAHGVMTAGLLLFLRYRTKPGMVAIAAVVMVCAGLIKHNLLPVPIAVTFWTMFYARNLLKAWLIAALAASAAGIVWILLQFGSDALWGIVMAPRMYSPWQSLVLSVQNFGLLATFAVLIAIYFANKKVAQDFLLILLYAIVSILCAAFTIGGNGVAINAFFDTYIATCILVAVAGFGLGIGKPHHPTVNNSSRLLVLALLASPIVFLVAVNGSLPAVSKLETRQQYQREQIKVIAKQTGPAICEVLALCFRAGKSFNLDFFNYGQKLQTKTIPDTYLENLIVEKRFKIIQMRPNSSLLPTRITGLIREHYREIPPTTSKSILLIPRSVSPSSN